MKQVTSVAQLREAVAGLRGRIALVPTMGNLHEGHLTLVRRAREIADHVVVSIFVNPLQFDREQDLQAYPRTEEQDLDLLRSEGVELTFTPSTEAIYPHSMDVHTRVEVPGLSDIFCGESRPGHFVGVATIVCKLFNMVQPQAAVFGRKDFQQLLIIRRMVEDLAMPIEIAGVDTVREADGLAMSSRNNYLDPQQRKIAPALFHALQHTAEALRQGERHYAELEENATQLIAAAGMTPDYFSIRRASDLGKPAQSETGFVILGAAFLGMARLIDNLEVNL
ncbi:pantoate--beta-alanine ligase [Thiolapillus sp.]|uniref:pantoate--beta-alanine ligase n=1 Tax=Thiolapillus sp. TaxID=2017437 RepID=UPI0025D69828|nr:pantoate--beta-alanine ligase [Thiolapillus sp.]